MNNRWLLWVVLLVAVIAVSCMITADNIETARRTEALEQSLCEEYWRQVSTADIEKIVEICQP